MHPALLVIDVQKAFFEINPATTQSLNAAIEYINAAIDLFREKDLPVICIQHSDENDGLVPGFAGFDLPEALKVLPTDLHIIKTYGNAFNKTPLLEELRAQGVDLKAIILRGSLASVTPEHIAFVEAVNEVISFGALRAVLG